jgi:hypothetical protein
MTTPNFLSLPAGMPDYLKSVEDQSWVFNFWADATSANRFLFQTTQVADNSEDSVDNQTGINISVYGNFAFFTFNKGPREALVGGQFEVGSGDLSVDVQSLVVIDQKIGHVLSFYHNGVHRITRTANAGNEAEVISWECSNNLYINRLFRHSPLQPAYYHRTAVFDKILTPHEIVNIHNESQPQLPIEPTVLDWNFNGNPIDSVNSIEFQNDFGIEITSEHVNVNKMGSGSDGLNYLNANVPVELLSSFSKTLMFRFKAIPVFHIAVRFVFSTFLGNEINDLGMMVRVVGTNVEISFHGTNHRMTELKIHYTQ